MAALDFPSSPTNGQTYTANGKTWIYDSATTSWLAYNPLDADLAAIAALTATSGVLKKTAADTWSLGDLTLEDLPGAWVKKAVRVATTANITLSGTQTIDGVVVAVGDRVLVRSQTTSANNGIYIVQSGAWSRATDANSADKIAGATVSVDQGTLLGGSFWSTNFETVDTLGTSVMPWYRVNDGSQMNTKSITVSSPTNAENIAMFYTSGALNLAGIRSVVRGTSPSVTFSIRYGTDRSATGTEVVTSGITVTNTTTGLSTTTLTNANIPAGNWVWLTTSATSGTVTELHVSLLPL